MLNKCSVDKRKDVNFLKEHETTLGTVIRDLLLFGYFMTGDGAVYLLLKRDVFKNGWRAGKTTQGFRETL